MADFVERLKQAARLGGSGDSQADIARDLGVKRQTVNRWFVLGGEPDVDLTFHISSRYGVDPKWLKTGDGNMIPDPSQDGLSTEERDLVRCYRGATKQVKEVIRTMARAARKVAVVVVAATIPPLLQPSPVQAATLPMKITGLCIMLNRRLREFMCVCAREKVTI